LAILEAREAGCAILATAVDGIPELLEHGRCGTLVPPQDSTALTEGMIQVLRDRSLRETLRREAKRGLERFTVNRMADEVSEIYSEIFDGSRVVQSVSV
jgi:glycosyltransferase involved in cell wall biosynthesis